MMIERGGKNKERNKYIRLCFKITATLWTDKMYEWQKAIRNLSVVPSSKYVNTIQMRITLQALMSIKNTCHIAWVRSKSKFVAFFPSFSHFVRYGKFLSLNATTGFYQSQKYIHIFCLINGIFSIDGGHPLKQWDWKKLCRLAVQKLLSIKICCLLIKDYTHTLLSFSQIHKMKFPTQWNRFRMSAWQKSTWNDTVLNRLEKAQKSNEQPQNYNNRSGNGRSCSKW